LGCESVGVAWKDMRDSKIPDDVASFYEEF